MEPIVNKILELDTKHKVEFIILFGSQTTKKATPLSDIDIAIFYKGGIPSRFNFRLLVSGKLNKRYDIQIFQDLPLYVRKEVLKGKILYYKNYSFMFDQVMETIKGYNRFKRHLDRYYDHIENEIITKR